MNRSPLDTNVSLCEGASQHNQPKYRKRTLRETKRHPFETMDPFGMHFGHPMGGHPYLMVGHPLMMGGHPMLMGGQSAIGQCKFCGIRSRDFSSIAEVGTHHHSHCPRYPSHSAGTLVPLEFHPCGNSSSTASSSDLGTRTLYHATNESAARSILENGFRCGSDGCVGGGIYFADSRESAIHKSRRGSSVVLRCRVNLGTAQIFHGSASKVSSSRIDRSGSVYLPDGASGQGDSEFVVFSNSRISDISQC